MRKSSERDYSHIEISPFYYMGKVVGTILRWYFLISVAFVILYPLLYMLSMSLRSPEDFFDVTVVWIPKTPTLANFVSAIGDIGMLDAMKNSTLISFVSTALQIFVTCLAGYGFARFRFKGNKLLFGVAVFTIMVPPAMLTMPNYLLLKNMDFFGLYHLLTGALSPINLLNTLWSYYIPAVLGQGLRAGIFILVFRQFFAGLPMELEEAALIDGCGYGKTFFKIMLPNATTPVIVYSLFSIVWYWGDYYTAYINLTSVKTLGVQLMNIGWVLVNLLPPSHQTAYYIIPVEQAACLLSILPLLAVFIIGQRYFILSASYSLFGSYPANLILALIAFFLAGLIIKYTKIGTYTYAIGSNEFVAKNMGVKVNRYKVVAFVLCGFFVGIMSILTISYGSSMTAASSMSSMGRNFMPLMGTFFGLAFRKYGRPITAIVIGEFIISLIFNGFVALGAPSTIQNVVTGAALLLIVMVTTKPVKGAVVK